MKDSSDPLHEIATAYCADLSGGELYQQALLIARFDVAISHLRTRLVSLIELGEEREQLCTLEGARQGRDGPRRWGPPERIPSAGNDAHTCCEASGAASREAIDVSVLEQFLESLPHIELLVRIEQKLWDQRNRAVRRFSALCKTAAETNKA